MSDKYLVVRRLLETDDADPLIVPRVWLEELIDEVEKLHQDQEARKALLRKLYPEVSR